MDNLLPEGGHPSLNQTLVLQSVSVAVQDRPVLGFTPTALGEEARNSYEPDGEGGVGLAWTAAFVECHWGPGNPAASAGVLRSSPLFPVETSIN